DVGELGRRLQVVGQVGKDGRELARLEEALTGVVLIEARDIRPVVQLLAADREHERSLQSSQLAVDGGIGRAGLPPGGNVLLHVGRGDLHRTPATEEVQDVTEATLQASDGPSVVRPVLSSGLSQLY